jgi:tetratricopeptide (TPR) repeat protein
MVAQLRHLRTAMENKRSLAQAYRQVESLLPELRRTAPNVVPRLAACLYWACLDTGPDDADRYARVFGPPPEDPHFHRIAALAFERAGERQDAQKAWEKYEKDVAARPEVWPGGQADRARALIWLRMGRNAVEAEEGRGLAPWEYFGAPPTLKPGADTCLRHSRDLAPDMREPYEALFHYHRDRNHPAKAEQAARALLERFPEDAAILEGLSDLRSERGDAADALALMQRALHANPLDRRLRGRVAWLHAEHARTLALGGRFDAARQEIQAAGAFQPEAPQGLNCLRAAVEFKAKEPDAAEAVLQEAAAAGQPALLTAYAMLVEATRLKLPPAVKKRFDRDFKTAAAGPADVRAALLAAGYAAALYESDVSYYGQKTHLKKLADYALKAGKADAPEDSVDVLVELLITLEAYGQAIKLARAAQAKFPHNPCFPCYEAQCMIEDTDRSFQPWRAASLLGHAERLAQAMPMNDRRRTLLDKIAELRRELAVEDPLGGPFGRIFDTGSAGDEDGDDFDDDW